MPFISWEDSLSVGVAAFDDDHRALIGYINELHMGLLAGSAGSAMTTVLDGLVEYTRVHFGREEDTMKKHGYPDMEAHVREHRALIEKVMDFREGLSTGRKAFSLELMGFLRDWLVNHIMKTDMKYSSFFREKGVG